MRLLPLVLLLLLPACTLKLRPPLVHDWPTSSEGPYTPTDSAKVYEIPWPSVDDRTWKDIGVVTVYPMGQREKTIRAILKAHAAAMGGHAYFILLTPKDVGTHLQVDRTGRVGYGLHFVDQWKITVVRRAR